MDGNSPLCTQGGEAYLASKPHAMVASTPWKHPFATRSSNVPGCRSHDHIPERHEERRQDFFRIPLLSVEKLLRTIHGDGNKDLKLVQVIRLEGYKMFHPVIHLQSYYSIWLCFRFTVNVSLWNLSFLSLKFKECFCGTLTKARHHPTVFIRWQMGLKNQHWTLGMAIGAPRVVGQMKSPIPFQGCFFFSQLGLLESSETKLRFWCAKEAVVNKLPIYKGL